MKKLLCILAALALLTASAVSCEVDTPDSETESRIESTDTAPETDGQTHEGTDKETEAETEEITEEETEETTEAETEETTEAETEEITEAETEPPLADGLPDGLNFNGEEVVIFSTNPSLSVSNGLPTNETYIQAIHDAFYERDYAVEKRLNVKISHVESNTSALSTILTLLFAEDQISLSDYDIIVDNTSTMFVNTLSAHFVDLLKAPYIDLTQPWWTQGYNAAANLGGMQFSATGSMLLSPYRSAMVTVFNKNLFDSLDQPYLYDYVRNHTWTLDKQAALAPLFHSDNGNGTKDLTGDVYGFVSVNNYSSVDAYWSSCQLDIVRKEDLTLQYDETRIINTASKIVQLFHGAEAANYISDGSNLTQAKNEISTLFGRQYAAMATMQTRWMEQWGLHTTGNWYGIVPMPKLDEAQESYYTYLDQDLQTVAILAQGTDEHLGMVCAVVEAMSSEGYNSVRPVYEREIFHTQDPTAKEMLRIIADGIRMDLGIAHDNIKSTVVPVLRDVAASGINSAKPKLRIVEKAASKYLINFAHDLDDLRDKLGYTE